MNINYLIQKHIEEYGVKQCPTKWAQGVISGGWNCTRPRSKKNCNYNFDSPIGIRTLNYDSVYNAPSTHKNGAKIVVGSEGTNYAAEIA